MCLIYVQCYTPVKQLRSPFDCRTLVTRHVNSSSGPVCLLFRLICLKHCDSNLHHFDVYRLIIVTGVGVCAPVIVTGVTVVGVYAQVIVTGVLWLVFTHK